MEKLTGKDTHTVKGGNHLHTNGTSKLAVWDFHLPTQGVWVQFLLGIPPAKWQKKPKHKQQKQYCNKFNKNF